MFAGAGAVEFVAESEEEGRGGVMCDCLSSMRVDDVETRDRIGLDSEESFFGNGVLDLKNEKPIIRAGGLIVQGVG